MQPRPGSAKQVTRGEVRRRRGARGVGRARTAATDLAGHAEALVGLATQRRTGAAPGALPGAPALTVALYVSLPGEPGTAALRRRLAGLGHRVLLPWLREDRDLDWVVDVAAGSSDPMRPPGPRLGPGAVTGTDLVLVPALAVDGDGTRLGQGGGSYDRALVRLGGVVGDGPRVRPLVLAVVHDEEVLPPGTLPREAHDVPVDGVLTPSGLRLLPPP